jgi:hypothetical protein
MEVMVTDNQWQIFDAAMKRLMGLSAKVIVAFINGLFELDFPTDSRVSYPNKEQVKQDLTKQFTDIIIGIHFGGNDYYFIIEVQIKNDGIMLFRVFQYGYEFALGNRVTEGTVTTIRMPKAMVIYLNPNSNTPYSETLRLVDSDGNYFDYNVKSFRLLDFTPAELADRNMELLFPFQLLKLRSRIEGANNHEQRVALVQPLKEFISEIIPLIENAEATSKLTIADTTEILGILDKLDKYLYTDKYKEFQEVNKMVQDLLYPSVAEIESKSRQEGVNIGVDKTLDAVSAFLRSKGYNDTDIREAQQYAKQQTLSELAPA